MTIGSISTDRAVQPTPQTNEQQQVRQQDQEQRQVELENTQEPSANNTPDPNSRVGSVINTQV